MKERKWSRVFMIFSPVYIFIGMHSVSNYLLKYIGCSMHSIGIAAERTQTKKSPQGGANHDKKNN